MYEQNVCNECVIETRIVAQTIHVIICLNSNIVPSFQHLTTS